MNSVTDVPYNKSVTELEEMVRALYPSHPLDLVGFRFGRFRKGGTRLRVVLLNPQSVQELSKSVRQGKLLVVPNRPIQRVREMLLL